MFRSAARGIQGIFFVIGFLILGYCGADWLNSRLRQAQGNRELDRVLNFKPAKPAPQARIADGSLIGRVEIPKLHLSAVVFQGTDAEVLDRGVGHLDSSAMPGQAGNVVLAAHRDSFFRSLRDIGKGDVVQVTTPAGPRKYLVDSTEIVDPTETRVMEATAKPMLTLITCYPFYYVGHAPKRFIVHASDTQPMPPAPEILTQRPQNNKRTAQVARSMEPVLSRLSPQETEDLTYVVRASQ